MQSRHEVVVFCDDFDRSEGLDLSKLQTDLELTTLCESEVRSLRLTQHEHATDLRQRGEIRIRATAKPGF